MIPPFDERGNLPPGIHWATWQEIVDRFGYTPHRQRLLDGLGAALESLRVSGCRAVYIDGSFVTAKEGPADFDACWDDDGVNRALLDPILLRFDNQRRAQKLKYLGELFPARAVEASSRMTFLEYFQFDTRTRLPKGIVALDPRGWRWVS